MPVDGSSGVSLTENQLVRSAWSELAAGKWAAALRLAEQARQMGAPDGTALHLRGLAQWGSGDRMSAAGSLEQAATFSPTDTAVLNDLAVARFGLGDWAGAAETFATLARLVPGDPEALKYRTEALGRCGQYAEARGSALAWAESDPGEPAAMRAFAVSLLGEKKLHEAFEAALANHKRFPESEPELWLMSAICGKQRRYEKALEFARAAEAISTDSPTAQARLAVACWDAGDLTAALQARKRALSLGLKDRNLLANLCWIALHDPDQTGTGLLTLHQRAVAALSPSPAQPCGRCEPLSTDQRLRVGYLSGEFVSNPATYFLAGWLRHHDSAQVETFYYMARAWSDTQTEEYKRLADCWRDVSHMSDSEIAETIRQDGVEILVDLSGQFEDNRLSVFGLRPAPIQATFAHYPSTTGSNHIDYIFTDRWTTPNGCESEYAERPWRLDSGYVVYEATEAISRLTESPLLRNGFVTFGLFQRPGKLHSRLWDVIGSVLRGVPQSQLLLHCASTELDELGSAQQRRMLECLEARGICPSRVMFEGTRIGLDHFQAVAKADIAFDSFPYNGQTTTCDCLWMGVPVVTLRGNTHVSRVGSALLERMGLNWLVAENIDDYVRIGIELAGDKQKLVDLRSEMRDRMRRKGLTDGQRLAREIEAAYRVMCRQ